MQKQSLFIIIFLFSIHNVSLANPCLEFQGELLTDIQAPPCGSTCGTPQVASQVRENNAYLFYGTANSEYTLSFCNGYNSNVWDAVITVGEYNSFDGEAYPNSDFAWVNDCSLTFTTPATDTFIIVITALDNCGGESNDTSNGQLSIDCGANGASCPACHAGNLAITGSTSLCPGQTTALSTDGSEEVFAGGGFGWHFSDRLGGTGGDTGGDFVFENFSSIILNETLGGEINTPLGGTWVVKSVSFTDINKPMSTICSTSADSLTVSFLINAPTAGTLTGGNTQCAGGILTASIGTPPMAPAGVIQLYVLTNSDGTIIATNDTPDIDLSEIDFSILNTPECGVFTMHSIVMDGGFDASIFSPGGLTLEQANLIISYGAFCGEIDLVGTDFTVTCDNIELTTSTNPSHCNMPDGTANVSVTGGTPPYTYSWSNGESTDAITGLLADTLMIEVTDAIGCNQTAEAIVLNEDDLETSLENTVNVACFGDSSGEAAVSASGGTTPYTYTWSNGMTADNITGIPAGLYNCIIVDSNGCSDTINDIQIFQPEELLFENNEITDVTCNGDADGTISNTTTGGTQSYTYLWSNGSSSENLINLGNGTYSATITDANNCQVISESFTVNEPEMLTVTIDTITQDAIYITTSGGTQPYTYEWSNGASSEDNENIPIGSYACIINDANGCNLIFGPVEVSETVGISEVEGLKAFDIFPNPTSDSITINFELEKSQLVRLSIHDVSGRLIHHLKAEQVSNKKYQIDMTKYPAGVYTVRANINGNRIAKYFVIN